MDISLKAVVHYPVKYHDRRQISMLVLDFYPIKSQGKIKSALSPKLLKHSATSDFLCQLLPSDQHSKLTLTCCVRASVAPVSELCVCVSVHMLCVCVCVCVCAHDVCVCVCNCV